MSATLRAILLMSCLTVCAHGQTRRLAVSSKQAHTLDRVSATALRRELQRLLIPAGIDVTWESANKTVPGGDFELVVVGSFEGNCSVADLSHDSMIRPRPHPLGDSPMSSDGRVLPFFRVDCERIVRMLTPALEPLDVPLRNVMFGRAMARVIAHEIYHFLSQVTVHDESGVAKASFSLADLTAGRFDFDSVSLKRMEPSPPAIAFAPDQPIPYEILARPEAHGK